MSAPRIRQLLVLMLAASAGVHLALVPAHAAESSSVGAMFALSALMLAALALLVDTSARAVTLVAAALLLGSLLALYAGSRIVAVWPLEHSEPVDAIGALTKLFEAAGLVLALRLMQTPTGSVRRLPGQREGAGP